MSDGKPIYPTRPPFFAHRYCRLLTKTCAAQEIGPAAFVLCVTIAHLEDAKRYRGAVTFFNEQLMPLVGVTKWDSLDRARKRAAESGWLHYESGNRGKRQPGRYWVTIPPGLDSLDDTSCDESQSPENGEWIESQSPTHYPVNGEREGEREGELSTLTLSPNLTLSSATPPVSEDNEEKTAPKSPREFFGRWNRFAKTKGLRTARVLSKDRETKIRRRLASPGWFQLFAESLAKLPIPNDERFVWQPDLDWMVANDVNVAKLAEGKYDGRGQSSLQTAQAPAEPLDDYVN